jgi:two-component system, NtrC family, response regulator HydG
VQSQNQYWKTIVDTIQDGVMIVNPEGAIVSVNRGFEEITGFEKTDVLGKPCTILNCSNCAIARKNRQGLNWCVLFEQGHLKRQKCLLYRKDGRPVHIVKNAALLKDENGEVIGAVETMTDISDLTEKECQIESYRKELDGEDRFHDMIGQSASMRQLFGIIENAAVSDAPVIIYGESGTGKELVARAIHEAGLRAGKPYIKVNCAALNESLLETELFGHVKGAFTGALQSRIGRFEAATGGDIFLDEIGDLPLATQIKLLRVLEEKVIERVGDHRPVKVDVRIISATNRDLPGLIARGEFREDFYYRINAIPMRVPPLRERAEDIPLLARSFFNRLQLKSGRKILGISNDALEALMKYQWPGNVRELKSAFEYAFVSCQGETIEPLHLPMNILETQPVLSNTVAGGTSLDDIKKQRLIKALDAAAGNRSEAARILGISRTSVWNQMKRFGLSI